MKYTVLVEIHPTLNRCVTTQIPTGNAMFDSRMHTVLVLPGRLLVVQNVHSGPWHRFHLMLN